MPSPTEYRLTTTFLRDVRIAEPPCLAFAARPQSRYRTETADQPLFTRINLSARTADRMTSGGLRRRAVAAGARVA